MAFFGSMLMMLTFATVLAFNLFAMDALMRMQADIQVMRRSLGLKPPAPLAAAAASAAASAGAGAAAGAGAGAAAPDLAVSLPAPKARHDVSVKNIVD